MWCGTLDSALQVRPAQDSAEAEAAAAVFRVAAVVSRVAAVVVEARAAAGAEAASKPLNRLPRKQGLRRPRRNRQRRNLAVAAGVAAAGSAVAGAVRAFLPASTP